MIREPLLSDVADLARIHVQAWQETYPALLPTSEVAAYTLELREKQWHHQITANASTIAYAPGLGFAQSGPQRDGLLFEQGFIHELYAIYLLDAAKGTGTGAGLFAAVRPATPFTALVLADNTRAIRFYIAQGAHPLETRTDRIGETEIRETVMAWR